MDGIDYASLLMLYIASQFRSYKTYYALFVFLSALKLLSCFPLLVLFVLKAKGIVGFDLM